MSSGVALPQLTNNELPLSHSLCACDSILWRRRGDEDKDTKVDGREKTEKVMRV